MKSLEKIGILGGTFNPIHLGHLILAQTALEIHDLSKLLFVPCFEPPHKITPDLLGANHRVAMVKAAVEGSFCFEVSLVEIERGGVSYAVDTVTGLQEMYPGSELFFIIGTDTLRELHMWKDIYSLLPLCHFVAFSRPRHEMDTLRPDDMQLDPPWPQRLFQNTVRGRHIDISSSNIRYRIAEGLSISYLVPPAVEMYIAEHGLYGSA